MMSHLSYPRNGYGSITILTLPFNKYITTYLYKTREKNDFNIIFTNSNESVKFGSKLALSRLHLLLFFRTRDSPPRHKFLLFVSVRLLTPFQILIYLISKKD